jgi:hypothetical protein
MKVCNLTQGSVIMFGNTVQCNGDSVTDVSEVELIGSSLTHFVNISNTNVVVRSVNAFINTSSVVTISSSTVRLVLDGSSFFSSLNRDSAGLGCSLNSNVTIQAVLGGSLLAIGGRYSAGIGSMANCSCGSVTIFNGSFNVRGGVGLGLSWSQFGRSS